MKTFKTVLIIIFLSLVLLFLNSCKRSNIDDPNMIDSSNTVGKLKFSGSANPSVLYIAENRPEVSSTISVSLLDSDGVPARNIKIVFQKGEYGYFSGQLASTTAFTDGSGIATVKYYIPHSTSNGDKMGDTYIQIKATVADDSILQGQATDVVEYINIRLIPYDSKDRVKIAGRVTSCCPETGLECAIIALSNNGALADGVTQSRPSGSYDLFVPKGWSGTITPTLRNYEFTPNEISIESPLYHDLNEMNFIASPSEGYKLMSDFSTYTFTAGGATSVSANVYCNVPPCNISYRVVSAASFIVITSGSTGVTNGSFTFSVLENFSDSSRSGEIVIIANDGKAESFTITVEQEAGSGSGITLQSDFSTIEIDNAGETRTAQVYCSDPSISIDYRIETDVTWITIRSGDETGSTPGSFQYTVAANSTGETRSGIIRLVPTDRSGDAFEITITQTEPTANPGTLSISRTSYNQDNTAASGINVNVYSSADPITYTVASGASWVTITSGASGTTPGSFTFSIAANGTGAQRTATITVTPTSGGSSQTLTITQDA